MRLLVLVQPALRSTPITSLTTRTGELDPQPAAGAGAVPKAEHEAVGAYRKSGVA